MTCKKRTGKANTALAFTMVGMIGLLTSIVYSILFLLGDLPMGLIAGLVIHSLIWLWGLWYDRRLRADGQYYEKVMEDV